MFEITSTINIRLSHSPYMFIDVPACMQAGSVDQGPHKKLTTPLSLHFLIYRTESIIRCQSPYRVYT